MTTRKDIFHHSQKLELYKREMGTSLELQKRPSRLDHQLDQQRDPTSLPCPQHESSYNLLSQWDPGEKSLLPQLFRKATASKIIYFQWIQSEYNLSCMLSKHWGFLKILQVIQKLLILLELIPLISRSATYGRTRKSD